mgnify:CR=1 FL=1
MDGADLAQWERALSRPAATLLGAPAGGEQGNHTGGQQRADAVARYLASKGVAAGRLRTEGRGSDQPIAGRAPTDPMNRRVQARLVG